MESCDGAGSVVMWREEGGRRKERGISVFSLNRGFS
jgi:hypothetical protein